MQENQFYSRQLQGAALVAASWLAVCQRMRIVVIASILPTCTPPQVDSTTGDQRGQERCTLEASNVILAQLALRGELPDSQADFVEMALRLHRARHGWMDKTELCYPDVVPPGSCDAVTVGALGDVATRATNPALAGVVLEVAELFARNHEYSRASSLLSSMPPASGSPRYEAKMWFLRGVVETYMQEYSSACTSFDALSSLEIDGARAGIMDGCYGATVERTSWEIWALRAAVGVGDIRRIGSMTARIKANFGVQGSLMDANFFFDGEHRRRLCELKEVESIIKVLGGGRVENAASAFHAWEHAAAETETSLLELAGAGDYGGVLWRVERAEWTELVDIAPILELSWRHRSVPTQEVLAQGLWRSARPEVGTLIVDRLRESDADDQSDGLRESLVEWTTASQLRQGVRASLCK